MSGEGQFTIINEAVEVPEPGLEKSPEINAGQAALFSTVELEQNPDQMTITVSE